MPVDFVEGLKDDIISGKAKDVRAEVSGLNLEEYQIHALVSRGYNSGIGNVDNPSGDPGALGYRNGKKFTEAYEAYWVQERDNMFDGVTTTPDFSHSLYTQYMNKPVTAGNQYLYGLERRRKSEWALFQTGYYGFETDMHEWYREGGGAVVEEALSHVGEGYSKFGLADHWCAQFVSYCFDKCGLIPSVLPNWFTGCTTQTNYLRSIRKI